MNTIKEFFSGLPFVSELQFPSKQDDLAGISGAGSSTLTEDAGLIPVNALSPQEISEASMFLHKTSGAVSQIREPIDFPNLSELKSIRPSLLAAQGNGTGFDGPYCSSDVTGSTMGSDLAGTGLMEIAFAGGSGSVREEKKESASNLEQDLNGFISSYPDPYSIKAQSPSNLKQSWDVEKFAQQHHSEKDLDELSSLRKRLTEEIQSLNLPGQTLNKGQVDRRTELRRRLKSIDILDTKASEYNLDNYDQKKVNYMKEAFKSYKNIMNIDSATAGLFMEQFLDRNMTDAESKRILKTLCYDESNKNVGKAFFDKASQMETQEIFDKLQKNFPHGPERGNCGACADKVETCLKGMNLQFHSYNRIEGTIPFTHIATELIQNKYDNSQKAGSKDSIVLDMWLNGVNYKSGFDGLDYDAFKKSQTLQHAKMGAYKRDEWPIINGTFFEGTVR